MFQSLREVGNAILFCLLIEQALVSPEPEGIGASPGWKGPPAQPATRGPPTVSCLAGPAASIRACAVRGTRYKPVLCSGSSDHLNPGRNAGPGVRQTWVPVPAPPSLAAGSQQLIRGLVSHLLIQQIITAWPPQAGHCTGGWSRRHSLPRVPDGVREAHAELTLSIQQKSCVYITAVLGGREEHRVSWEHETEPGVVLGKEGGLL